MESSNEEASRIIDEKDHKMDERKSQEIEKTCTENEKQALDDSSAASSPVKHQKRKSELIVKSEIKRIRSSDCIRKEECQDKSLIDISGDEKLQLENTDVSSVSDCKSILDYTESGEDISGSSSEFEKLPHKHELDNADKVENKLMESSGRKVNEVLKLSYDISLQMDKNTTETNKAETSNTSRSAEYTKSKEILTERKTILISALPSKESHHRCIIGVSSISPKKLSSVIEFHPNNFICEEPEFATSGYFEDNAGLTNILKSFYQQQHSEENIKSENKIEEKRRISEKDDGSSSSSGTEDDLTIFEQNIALRETIKFLKHKGENLAENPDEILSQLKKFVENNPCLETDCTESEKTAAAAKSTKAYKTLDQETLENSDKVLNRKVFTKNSRPPVILFTTDNSTVISPTTENPQSPVISASTENLKSPLSPKKKSGNNSLTDDRMFKEYPGIAEEPTKVKKDARYQKRFYKQKPVKLPINWKTNTDSSTEPEGNVEDDDKDRTPRSGEDPSSLPKDREDSKPLVIHETKQSQSHENDLPGTSGSGMHDTDGYKLCSFMEESPTSTSDSVEEDNELVPCTSQNVCSYPEAEKWYQNAQNWLITHTSIASMQPSNSGIPKAFIWTIVKYNNRNTSYGIFIYIRDITNIHPLCNSLTRPVRLKPCFKVTCYADDRNDGQEFCIEEILKMLSDYRTHAITRDPQLESSYEIPLQQIPLRTSVFLIHDDDYELVGDYLMRIV